MEFAGGRRLATGESSVDKLSLGKQSSIGGNSIHNLSQQHLNLTKSGTMIPPLKIPKNPAHELNTRLAIERYESRESVESSSEISLSSSHS